MGKSEISETSEEEPFIKLVRDHFEKNNVKVVSKDTGSLRRHGLMSRSLTTDGKHKFAEQYVQCMIYSMGLVNATEVANLQTTSSFDTTGETVVIICFF